MKTIRCAICWTDGHPYDVHRVNPLAESWYCNNKKSCEKRARALRKEGKVLVRTGARFTIW